MSKRNGPWVRISKLCFAGLAAITPLVGTVWLLYIIFKILLRVGEGLVGFVWNAVAKLSGNEVSQPDFVGIEFIHFLLPIGILLGLGVILISPAGVRVQKSMEKVALKLPLIGFIYKSLDQFVEAIRGLGRERQFKSVVYVEYPSSGCRLLGFVTGEYHDRSRESGVTSVFVPTSPNPLTGFMILIDNEKIQPCDMTVEEASKMVLSAGLVTPKKDG